MKVAIFSARTSSLVHSQVRSSSPGFLTVIIFVHKAWMHGWAATVLDEEGDLANCDDGF